MTMVGIQLIVISHSLLFLWIFLCACSAQQYDHTNGDFNYELQETNEEHDNYYYQGEDFDQSSAVVEESEVRMACKRFVSSSLGPVVLVLNEEPSETIRNLYNLNSSDIGYIEVQSKTTGECVKIRVETVILNDNLGIAVEDSATNLLIHKDIREKLNQSILIIGVPFKQVYLQWEEKAYFIVTPLSVAGEEELGHANINKQSAPVHCLWPSPTVYSQAVALNVDMKSSSGNDSVTTVSFLYYAQTEDSLEFTDLLKQAIKDKTNCKMRTLDLYTTLKLLEQGNDDGEKKKKIRSRTRYVRRNMVGLQGERQADIVVMYMDLPVDKKRFLIENLLFDDNTGLDELKITWLIADMTLAYSKLPQQRVNETRFLTENEGVLSSPLHFLIPNMEAQPQIDETMTLSMPHEGIVEAGLKKALMLSKIKLEAIVHDTGWNASDFFVTCSENTSSCVVEAQRRQNPIGFPTNVQIATKSREMIQKDGFPAACRSPGDCDFTSIFARTELISSECQAGTNDKGEEEDDGVKQIQSNSYTLCGIKARSRTKRIPQYAVVIQDSPFVIKNRDGSYDGLAMEIYKRVAAELAKQNIVLNLKFMEETAYGTKNHQGGWTGVMGKLSQKMEKDTDNKYKPGQKYAVLGLGQISMTRERAHDPSFVFSPPFAYSYYTYIVRKSTVYDAYLSFTRPFSMGVWLTILTVLFTSGFYLFVLETWNPFKESSTDRQTLTAHESFWHSFMVITQTGAPFGTYLYPSRVYSVFYWFFALVVCACYTGNLASFLTESKYALTWRLGDEDYTYGVVANTSVSRYTEEARIGSHWRQLLSNPVFVPNYTTGVQRVKHDKFVLIGTSLVLEDFVQKEKECKYYMWKGSTFQTLYSDSKIEPIAFPIRRRWRYAKLFHQTMERLLEDGDIQKIYRKWIKPKNCQSKDTEDQSLAFENFLGLFILITVAIIISYIFLAIKLIHLRLRDGPQKEEDEEVTDRLTKPTTELTEMVCSV